MNVKVREDLHVTVEHNRHIKTYFYYVLYLFVRRDFILAAIWTGARVRAMLSVHHASHHYLFQLEATRNGDFGRLELTLVDPAMYSLSSHTEVTLLSHSGYHRF